MSFLNLLKIICQVREDSKCCPLHPAWGPETLLLLLHTPPVLIARSKTQQLGWGLQEANLGFRHQRTQPGALTPRKGSLSTQEEAFGERNAAIRASVSLILSSTTMVLAVLRRYGWSLVPSRYEFSLSFRAFLYLLAGLRTEN